MRLEKWLAASVGARTPHLTNFENPKSCHLQIGKRKNRNALNYLTFLKDVGFCNRDIKAEGVKFTCSAELPPPYTAIASPDASGVPVINCRVCQSLINLDGKLHQHVVKCTVCNEATPIKNPPAGKKYVRCQCNCLLICKDTSRKIGCPRPNCRRIITLGPVMLIPEEQPAQPALPVQPDGTRVVCGHCGNTFLWMELRFNTLAKCPHCKKISSVGSALPRRRCCAYITIGMICIFIGVGLTVGTQDFARRFHATYVSWAIAYLLGLICLIRACYWGAIKVSYPEHSFA
ncbi:PREDICTED: type 2 phosphatidylinositol 4,5-bisphosphate 4-phosphatase [Pygoscelis adeliae]|uniref:type 2 phosphatidylinositol 4,5-bisphosphate 4-phosphatase n=1 Tax=Pygoscelis adeliae TaxID=9238 RepID=UPI0004F4EB29|nr:PREDICTED: type 2 phosphatidylinositol 4,5-bisphosphate 4-phosphatase [Pygoscelis adeliae]